MGGVTCVIGCIVGCIPGVSCVVGCVPGIGCLFCGSCSIGCLFCSGGCGADCSIGCQYCGTCCTSCNSCCNTCCTCCCGSCKTKTPKVPKVGGGSGGKGGAGGASPSAGGLSATNLSPALCGQASALTNTGGNYSIDALEKVDPHQLVGAPMSPQLMMGYAKAGSVKESNIVEGEHDTPKSGLGQLVEGISGLCLKNATPSFMCCSKCTAFHPQMTQHNTELKSLQQIKPVGKLAKGGLPHKYHEATPEGHHPEFITGITGYYACGGGTGQSDDIPAILHDGDYVMDAETVSALGDGSSKAGMHVLEEFREKVPHHDKAGENPVPAKIADGEYVFPSAFVTALGKGDNKAGADILDGLREKLREHKRGASIDKIPPKAKSPLDYIKKGKA